MATDCDCPEAQSPASGIAKRESVTIMLIKSPTRFWIRNERYSNNATMGITNPKPVRNDMLIGRNGFGDRFVRIRLKMIADMVRQITCHRYGFILWVSLCIIVIQLKLNHG